MKLLILNLGIPISAKRFQPIAHLETIALLSSIAAKSFPTFFPSVVLINNGIHIQHFWISIRINKIRLVDSTHGLHIY
jgi:hypothetical protein